MKTYNFTEITFFTHIEELKHALPPVPARDFWPEWFKQQTGHHTVKTCPGILDVLGYGYIIPLWSDFSIKRGPGPDDIEWRIPDNLHQQFGPNPQHAASTHPGSQIEHYPFPPDTFHGSFKLINPWLIKTAPGYSCYICEPQYNTHPNLKVLSGIIDTDIYHEAHLNNWFTAPAGEEKILSLGMPIAQVIPFKREQYEMKVEVGDKRSLRNKINRFIHNAKFSKGTYRDKLMTNRYK